VTLQPTSKYIAIIDNPILYIFT